MAQIETWVRQDLQKPVKVKYLDGNVFSADNDGNLVGVEVYSNNQPVNLSGSISGSVIRSDGVTVAISGTYTDNRASIVLPSSAYLVPGVVSIIIKNTSGSQTTTLAVIVANVYQSSTDTIVDPGTILPSIADLIAAIDEAVASIPPDYSSVWTTFAPEFSSGETYKIGQYCTYDGGVYRFTKPHTGEWDTNSVIVINIGNELRGYYGLGKKFEDVDGKAFAPISDFNIGNIVISVNGWTYQGDILTRVSTKKGLTYHLVPGDVIALSDYTNARVYIGWIRDSDGTYGVSGWMTSDFTVYQAGQYVINIDQVPSTTQVNEQYLYDLLSIRLAAKKETNIENRLGNMETVVNETTENNRNYIYTSEWDTSGRAVINFNGDNVIVTPSSENTWNNVSTSIDTSSIDYVTVSYNSITVSGTVPEGFESDYKIRYGKVVSGTNTWIGFINSSPTTINVSEIDTLRIGLYVTRDVTVTPATSIVFNKLQIENGIAQTEYTNASKSAIDRYARSDIDSLKTAVYGSSDGNREYYGEKIVISNPEEVRMCVSELWKNFAGADIPSLSTYKLHLNQSMTVFGGYVFLFQSDGSVVIVDYSTKAIVSTASISPSSDQHANSAQFSNIYYDSADEFPLLLVSRCGNSNTSSGTTDPELDALQFYRVTRSSSTFTFTLINKIILNVQTYGSSWGIDNNSKLLYVCYYKNGNWSVTTDNPLYFNVFNLPSETDILSGDSITFNTSDSVADYSVDFAVFQGMTVHGRKAYLAVGMNGEPIATRMRLWAVDAFNGIIKSDVPFGIETEPEGVSIYGSSVYVSFRNSSDTSGVNPLRIQKYTF